VRGFVLPSMRRPARSYWKTYTVPAPGEPAAKPGRRAAITIDAAAARSGDRHLRSRDQSRLLGTGNARSVVRRFSVPATIFHDIGCGVRGDVRGNQRSLPIPSQRFLDWDEKSPRRSSSTTGTNGRSREGLINVARNGYSGSLSGEGQDQLRHRSTLRTPERLQVTRRQTGRPDVRREPQARPPARPRVLARALWGARTGRRSPSARKRGMLYIPANGEPPAPS